MNIKYFTHNPHIIKFTAGIIKGEYNYKYRWGDAIIRYVQIVLFNIDKREIRCYDDIQYSHNNWMYNCMPKLVGG